MSEYITTHEELLKLHGAKVTCRLTKTLRKFVEDAKICVEGKSIYVCQNQADGANAKDKLGYKYSWKIADKVEPDLEHWGCFDLKLVEPNQVIESTADADFKPVDNVVKHTADKVIEELDERLDDLTPDVILEATKTWDNFIKVWNEIHHKAKKIKSNSTLEKFTRKVKELVE